MTSYKDALEKTFKNFITYALSLIAALAVDRWVSNVRYYRTHRGITVILIVMISMCIISLLSLIDTEDS